MVVLMTTYLPCLRLRCSRWPPTTGQARPRPSSRQLKGWFGLGVIPTSLALHEDRPARRPQLRAVRARHAPCLRLDDVLKRVELLRVRVVPAGQPLVPLLAEPDELAQPRLEPALLGGDDLPIL